MTNSTALHEATECSVTVAVPSGLLQCPISGERLRLEESPTDDLIAIIRARQVTMAGPMAEADITGVLITENGHILYPVLDGILVLLPAFAIRLDNGAENESQLCDEKQVVRNFYDQYGWKKTSEGMYCDTAAFVSLHPLIRRYHSLCLLRVARHLEGGRYLLDAGCGAMPHAEHVGFSSRYAVRICVDLSWLALQEARQKIGSKGIYILGDITNLPLCDNQLDAVVSLHTIYHIPAQEQPKAIEELYRVAKSDATVVIAYSWGKHAPIATAGARAHSVVQWLTAPLRFLKQRRGRQWSSVGSGGSDDRPKLYNHPHPYQYFATRRWGFKIDTLCFRFPTNTMADRVAAVPLLGRVSLRLIFWLEDLFPRLLGRLGQYPLFLIRKSR